MTSALAPHHLRQRVGRLLEDRARRSTWDARAAVVLLESLARLPIGSAYFHHVAGILHAAAGRHARAVACQERALRAGPGRHAAAMHGRRGMSEFRLGEHAAAEASFRGAIETGDPRASGYWLGLVQAMTRLGRRTEAERALVDAALAVPGVDGRPGVPLAWYIFEGGWGRDSLADDLGEVVRRYPGAEEPMISLSLMENARGRIAEGTDLMQRAAALHWPFPGAAGSTSACAIARKEPAFILVGQPKAGTSAVFECLATHEYADPPLLKEPQFWSDRYECGREWYRAVFPPLSHRPHAKTFEASVGCFTHPLAARRISEHAPGTRIIVILRDSVARVHSEYQLYWRLGAERRPWDEIVDTELSRFPTCPLDPDEIRPADRMQSFLMRGAALPHLRRWVACFPQEQLLVLRHRDLVVEPEATLARICRFVDIPVKPGLGPQRGNEGFYEPMAAATQGRLQPWYEAHDRALDDFLIGLRGSAGRAST